MSRTTPDYLNLDEETLKAQRAARESVKRDSRFIMIAVFGGLILLYGLYTGLDQRWVIYLILPFIFVIYMVSNWRQWVALLTFELRCPHCHRRLAERVNLLSSPTPNCPHCGQRALAPIKQLEQ